MQLFSGQIADALNDDSVLNYHRDRFVPTSKRLLEIDIIVNAGKQPAGARFLKHSVQIPAALTEIVVARIAEREDRKPQFTKGRLAKIFDVIEKGDRIIRRLSLPPCTDRQQHG